MPPPTPGSACCSTAACTPTDGSEPPTERCWTATPSFLNLLSDGFFTNTWDDADRLASWTDKENRLEFTYNGLGQRIEKRTIRDGETNTVRYVWDGWLPLAVLDGNDGLLEYNLRGRDLSGSLEGGQSRIKKSFQ